MTAPADPPPWQLHEVPGYSEDMRRRCADLLSEIKSDAQRRRAILTDPKALHRDLFAHYAPVTNLEYAGGYRGTPGPSLANRVVAARSELNRGAEYCFLPPDEVPLGMEKLLNELAGIVGKPPPDDNNKLRALAHVFSWFGYIHPFLDGNGHVQRALLAAMATEFGIPLTRRFTIHPRPHDQLMAIALELFAAGEDKNSKLRPIAEHISFFLGGPFQEPLADFN